MWATGLTKGSGASGFLDANCCWHYGEQPHPSLPCGRQYAKCCRYRGDKVEAQIKFGWEVDAYPVNEIAEYVNAVSKGDIDALVEEYYNKYDILLEGRDPEEFKRHVAVQAGIEIGFEKFLEEKKLSGNRNSFR